MSDYSLRKVLKGASIYSIGDVLVKASGFFLIPLYTRVLTPADYGVVGYLQVFSSILIVILGFGFHGAQTRYYFEHIEDTKKVGSFLFTINITTVIMFFLFFIPLVGIGYLRGWTIGNAGIPFHPYLSMTLLSVLFSILNGNVNSALRMKQRFSTAVVVNASTFVSTTLFTIMLVVLMEKGALGRISGNLLGLLLVFLIFYYPYAKQFEWNYSLSALKYAVAFGFPIVIHLLMGTIHNSIDRIMLERYLPIAELGIYSLAVTVSSVLEMFVTAFNQAYQPSYYQLMESGSAAIEKHTVNTFKIWLGLVTIATAIGMLFGGSFLTFFAGEQFKRVSVIFPYLLLSVYFGSFYYFFSSPIFFFKKTHILPFITGSSAVINISLNLVLIPKLGIIGAAIATILSHTWISIASYWFGDKLFRIKWPLLLITISVVIAMSTFLISINKFSL